MDKARASPITRLAVVLAVGANPKGHASEVMLTSRFMSAALPSVEFLFPIIAY